MAKSKEHLGKETPSEFSEEAIRRFLFGRLSADEQVMFEERLLVDDRLEGKVRRAECDLSDDYAFGRLDDNERDLFKQRFLLSQERQQILRTSSALRDHFATESDVTHTVSLRTPSALNSGSWNRMMVGLHNVLALRVW